MFDPVYHDAYLYAEQSSQEEARYQYIMEKADNEMCAQEDSGALKFSRHCDCGEIIFTAYLNGKEIDSAYDYDECREKALMYFAAIEEKYIGYY